MRFFAAALTLLVVTACDARMTHVSLCDLAKDPAKYNHQEIEISGYVSHAFEDFTLFDPKCESPEFRLWLEYGGKYGSGTIYCCNDPTQARAQELAVDGVRTTLRQDGRFRALDALIQKRSDTLVYATLRGRFFSGEKQKLPGGTMWIGYGHFGLSSLFVIEEVVRLDSQRLPDLDYGAEYDRPNVMDGEGCFSSSFDLPSHRAAINHQNDADSGTASWRFDSPMQVVLSELQPQVKAKMTLKAVKVSPARIVYDGTATGRPNRLFVTVSRPYWLTHAAADPRHVIWVLTGAYEYGCPHVP